MSVPSDLCTLNIVISKIILIRISWKLLLSNLTDVKVNTELGSRQL